MNGAGFPLLPSVPVTNGVTVLVIAMSVVVILTSSALKYRPFNLFNASPKALKSAADLIDVPSPIITH